jgi:lysozyme family protein
VKQIKIGSRGDEVKLLQQRLAAKGFLPGGQDGVFGPQTEDAVVQFQASHGLIADGVVGTRTWAALLAEPEIEVDAAFYTREGMAPTVITLQDTRGMDKKQNGKGWSEDDLGYTVDAMATQGVAHPLLKGTAQVVEAQAAMSVRRLTPRECERLQGFPDDYTLVPYRKGLAADSHRYKALGNSMAVPVMRWIGARIALVDAFDQGDNP